MEHRQPEEFHKKTKARNSSTIDKNCTTHDNVSGTITARQYVTKTPMGKATVEISVDSKGTHIVAVTGNE